ncbi:unnamed protein product [Larinioides sclopetarius]|uniref:Uncharacterized protein n=1 Tax=Larinioides sclopetarius TaxID=280406 RepID=A0AAV2AMQ2_9ARAC
MRIYKCLQGFPWRRLDRPSTQTVGFGAFPKMTMAGNRLILLITAIILIISNFETVHAGGSCQSYGHSCLGGHGKRNSEPPYGLHMLLQQALRPRNEFPPNDYRIADRDAYDFLRGFSDSIKALEDKAN